MLMSQVAHLCTDILEGWWGDNGEAEQEYVGLGIGERTKTACGISLVIASLRSQADSLVVFLPCCIP